MELGAITKENGRTIGFVLDCLFSNAIDLSEFKKWVDFIIENTPFDEIPSYIFELVDFNGPLFHLSKVMGFVPDGGLTEQEDTAIYGIAIVRGRPVFDLEVPESTAVDCLRTCKNVQDRFKAIFPFLPDLVIPN